MKNLVYVLAACFLIMACHKESELQSALKNDTPIIVSHRGVLQMESLENSLTEMEKGFEKGIRFFEIDIRENAEGKLYLLHDETLDRTTTGRGLLTNFSETSLQGITLKNSDETVPTFSAVLDWAKKRGVWLMLDVKSAPLDKVIKEVKAFQMEESILLLTFSKERAQEAFQVPVDFLVSVLLPDEESLNYYLESFPKERLVGYIPKMAEPNWFLQVKASGLPTLTDVMGEVDARAAAMGPEIYQNFQEKRRLNLVVSDYPLLW
jgi:hypothetical protein